MIPKNVYLEKDGQEKLKKGISILAGAVKSTLGPEGSTVLIEDSNVVGGYRVTKDGVTVAKSINRYDPVENLAVEMMKQAADQTAKLAGDGTTTSITLTEAILNAADDLMTDKNSRIGVIRAMKEVESQIVEDLEKRAIKVSGKRLVDVATVSANNDPVLGKIIAGAYKKVKHVTVENSPNHKTYAEVIEGLKIDRGYSSRFLITDEEKEEAVLKNPFVLISDVEINNLAKISEVLKHSNQTGRPVLLIANMTPAAMATMNLNVKNKVINVCHITPPSMGWRKTDLLSDLAEVLGGVFYSEDTGDNMETVNVAGLGEAEKIIVSADKTVIVRKKGHRDGEVRELVRALKAQEKEVTTSRDRTFIKERIANISGGVGVIYVGANSEIEQKEKYDRVDDAVRAVSAALDGGILPGGGVALLRQQVQVTGPSNDNVVAEDIMMRAICKPFEQIMINSGLNEKGMVETVLSVIDMNYGYNVKTGQYGDMIDMGIIDPAKVTISALQNAVSVATTIMSTNAIITNMREDDVQTTK
jgi:chaperonin GroEL